MEDRLTAIENYLKSNQFRTDVYEAFVGKMENGLPLGIGKRLSQDSAAIFAGVSPNKGFAFPQMTEVQRDAIVAPFGGLVIFNTTQNLLNQHDGTNWLSIGIEGYSTTDRDSLLNPLAGQVIFNTTTSKLNYYDGTNWLELLDTTSTINQPLVVENMTTTQRNAIVAPQEGRLIMNTTTDKLNVYTVGVWEQVTSI